MRITALALVLLSLSLSGCKRKEAEVDGVGPYRISTMKMKDYHGAACRDVDDGVAYCPTFETIDLGEQAASVDLYFESKDLEAPLVEILLAVRRCHEEALEKALTSTLGAPTRLMAPVLVWEQEQANIVATLPWKEGICEVSFLGPSQKERFERLMARGSR